MDVLPAARTWVDLGWSLVVLLGGAALLAGIVLGLVVRRWGPLMVISRTDASRVRRWAPRLRRASLDDHQRDDLTGLCTRAAMVDRGEALLAAAVAEGRHVGLVLFDLDGFKRVNDTLGHPAGDRVLAEVGRRTGDVVSGDDLAVRLGGDEFALLVHAEDGDALERRVEQLLDVLARPVLVDEVTMSVRPSVGLAEHPQDGQTVDQLLRAADAAMYEAKEAGGRWGRPGTSGSSAGGADAPAATGPDALARGLERGEVVVHYQPQVDGWTGSVTGFEALVRWHHPEHGLLLPDAFLPRAERSPVIATLTHQVLERALGDLPELQRAASGCTVAVNVSARSMLGHRLLGDLEDLVAASASDAADLVLEITEPAPQATREVRALLDGVRRLGCRVSVHGFGSAQTSLTALWQFPAVREVKIDPAIISQVNHDPEAARLCRAMISAARDLGVRVVAEGVEDSDTVHRLRGMGCDAFQGFLLGRPVPLAEVSAWAREWRRTSADVLGR